MSQQVLMGAITGVVIAAIASIAGTGAATGAGVSLIAASFPAWPNRLQFNSDTVLKIFAATFFGASAGYALSFVPWK